MTTSKLASLFLAASFLAACGGSGMGKAVRTDITTQMQGAEDSLSSCYAKALEGNSDLAGQIKLSFKIAAKTGQFEDVKVTRDRVGDDGLSQCVQTTVSGLKLSKPQKTGMKTTYPLDFSPAN